MSAEQIKKGLKQEGTFGTYLPLETKFGSHYIQTYYIKSHCFAVRLTVLTLISRSHVKTQNLHNKLDILDSSFPW